MVEVKPEVVIDCQKPGCTVKFSASNGPQTDHELVLREAAYHQDRRHIGIASLANLAKIKGGKPEPQEDGLYHVIELTLNGPEILTPKPVMQAHARTAASRFVPDLAPEYFNSRILSQNG